MKDNIKNNKSIIRLSKKNHMSQNINSEYIRLLKVDTLTLKVLLKMKLQRSTIFKINHHLHNT